MIPPTQLASNAIHNSDEDLAADATQICADENRAHEDAVRDGWLGRGPRLRNRDGLRPATGIGAHRRASAANLFFPSASPIGGIRDGDGSANGFQHSCVRF
jgi:hypothetical protein